MIFKQSLLMTARVSRAIGWRAEAAAERLDPALVPRAVPENAAFKDLHRGRRAFVIGNGPSLATQDLSGLRGELVFTMNEFDRHPLCRSLLPVYHFLADPEYNDGTPRQEADIERISDKLGASHIFVPEWPSLQSARLRALLASGRLHPIPLVGSLAAEPVTEVDMCTGLPNVQSVAQLALMVAVYMGCDPIYLTGVDSDWAADPDLDRHFYEERTLDETWSWPYEEILEATLTMFRGYRHLWMYCRSRGVQVYNCTAGGLLDVFPRKRWEDVVRQPIVGELSP
jgi:hypothetical protein